MARRGEHAAVQSSGRWRHLSPVERLGVVVAVAIWLSVALVAVVEVWRAR